MKPARSGSGVEWAITAFALWQSADLLSAWRHAPLERWGWLAFLVWLAPLFRTVRRTSGERPLAPFALALLITLAGSLGSLNAACYAGLATALYGFAGPDAGIRRWMWLIASVSWMPAFGWLAKEAGGTVLPAVRVGIALAGSLALWISAPPLRRAATP